MARLASLSTRHLRPRIGGYGSLGKVPAAATPNLRNDMYLVLDTTNADHERRRRPVAAPRPQSRR